ncbi:hypothetical protein GYMLUDRAFT_42177 [Collybiopsis luxurians FD-317 M1]|uniref:DUF1772-domain-containing protein n=1 Tax=Collybiopsis luxurians FD-317 M1 TaxID=944289 RepID=A0A0D0CHV0_9AGAR|nr:hypothetical protein GYMLUDRAFT_42177 [Collybiopsis luxurians FD-317 M1]
MSALLGTSTGIRIAVALGLSGSAWCSGAIMSFSAFAGPALLDPLPSAVSSNAPCIWEHLYNRGKKTMPPIAATTALAHAYAAYSIPNPLSLDAIQRTRNLFALAGVLTVLIVPYTLLAMQKTNSALATKSNVLKAKSDKGLTGETVYPVDEEAKTLLRRWNLLNTGRALLPLAGCAVGIVAVFF